MINISIKNTDKKTGEFISGSEMSFSNQTKAMRFLKIQARTKIDGSTGTKKDPIVTYTTSIIISES